MWYVHIVQYLQLIGVKGKKVGTVQDAQFFHAYDKMYSIESPGSIAISCRATSPLLRGTVDLGRCICTLAIHSGILA